MAYLFLLGTIIAETAAVSWMKLSGGFSNLRYSVLAYGLSFVFLTLALKSLPAGIANAVWAGASAVLVAIIGVMYFHERLSVVQVISLVLIVIGLIGLNTPSSSTPFKQAL